jgi:hypothetical protein
MSITYDNFKYDFFTPKFESKLTTPNFQFTPKITNVSSSSKCYNAPCKPTAPACASNVENMLGYGWTSQCPPNTFQTDIKVEDNVDCHSCIYTISGFFSGASNYCYGTVTQTCQSADTSMCNISDNIVGICRGSCQKGTDLDLSTQGGTGYIFCNYNYPFDSSFNIVSEYLNNTIGTWILAMYDFFSSPAQQNSGGSPKRIRDSNFIYACIYDFYNQLYHQNSHSGSEKNFQQDTFFLDFGQDKVDDNINNRINDIYNQCTSAYDPLDFSTNLQPLIYDSCKIPKINQVNDSFTVTFYLSWDLFNKYKSGGIAVLEEYINGMLGDKYLNIIVNNIENPQYRVKFKKPLSSDPKFDTFKMINFGPNGIDDGTYTVVDGGSDIYNTSLGDNNMLLYIEVTVEIDQWTPLLIVYCKKFFIISFSSDMCNNIGEQLFIKPIECLTDSELINYCGLLIQTNGYITQPTINKYLSNQNTPRCICYTSGLAPLNEPQINNPAAMCFNQNCTFDDKKFLGLDDSKCKNYCSTVFSWFNNPNPNSPQPRDISEIDWLQFDNLCNYNYKPLLNQTINQNVLITWGIITIVCTFSIFSFCTYKNYKISRKILITTITFILFSLSTWSLAKNYAGNGKCETENGIKFVCRNHKGKIIPNQYCPFVETCECTLGASYCGENKTCYSTTCYPINGARLTKNVTKPDINIQYLISSVVTFILLPISIYMLNIGNKNIKKGMYMICFSVLFVLILFILTQSITTVEWSSSV